MAPLHPQGDGAKGAPKAFHPNTLTTATALIIILHPFIKKGASGDFVAQGFRMTNSLNNCLSLLVAVASVYLAKVPEVLNYVIAVPRVLL